MIRSKPQFLTERVFAAIVVLSAMGVALFALVGMLEKLAIPWWHNEQRQRLLQQEED
jgi:ABC-type nitrate/sulfonate/bicarbonate transport system permease component